MNKDDKVFVAGHRGLVGSAVVRSLERTGYSNVLTATRQELDLKDRAQVSAFMEDQCPDVVILAAAKVGGIKANAEYPAEFIFDNLEIQGNVIDSAYRSGIKKLTFLGSSCIYPRLSPQPMSEDVLLTGALEPTNQWYAIAKIAGLKMCEAYREQYGFDAISLMPTNLYGPNDNFDLETSHVLPALIRKFHEATVSGSDHVVVWGSGTPRREFLHVDDLADAIVFLTKAYSDPGPINVGTGTDVSIAELATLIARVVGFEGDIVYDSSKPDGTPRKLLDVSRVSALGWRPSVTLEAGVAQTYDWFKASLPA
ncbi:MAG: GDP-L-fucose synthase [Pseudomonadota bacterium]